MDQQQVGLGCRKGAICQNSKEQLSEIEKDELLARMNQETLEEKLSELEELKEEVSSQLMLLRVELLRELKLGQDNTRKEMNTALANLASRLDGHESWLKGHESRLNGHESRLGDHDSRLGGHESWLNGHESRLGDHDSRLNDHDQMFDAQDGLTDRNSHHLWECEDRIRAIQGWEYEHSADQDYYKRQLSDHQIELEDHDMRITALESQVRGCSDIH